SSRSCSRTDRSTRCWTNSSESTRPWPASTRRRRGPVVAIGEVHGMSRAEPRDRAVADTEKSTHSALAVTSVCALVAAALGSVTELLNELTKLLEKWPALQRALEAVPASVRWVAIGAVLVAGVVGLVKARSKASRLRQ